jgi:cytoskeletal protein CcmA (bactofilin family)
MLWEKPTMLRKTKSVKDLSSIGSMGEKTIIGEQSSFKGSIQSNEDLVINGSVKGNIKLKNNHLIIGPEGQVEADIYAQNISIKGQLIGNIEAISNVEITKEADFRGGIKAKRIVIEDGSFLKAAIELVREPKAQRTPLDSISQEEKDESEDELIMMPQKAESSAIPKHLDKEDIFSDPEKVNYTNNIIRLFIKSLARQQNNEILDIGPVCADNINFLARHVKTLYVCDMFLQLNQQRSKSLPMSKFWVHLDYPPQNFDGILLWDLIDYLEDSEMSKLVELCKEMLRSHGLLMVFSMDKQATQTGTHSFVISDDYDLTLRPQPHLDLPFHMRHSREVLDLFAPFTLIKSLIHHTGFRQLLFQRDAHA